MYNYFSNKDVPVTIGPSGELSFNHELIIQRVRKSFVMPKWVEDKVSDILNDDLFKDTANPVAIVNSTVVALNNLLIPIMRTAQVEASNINKFLDASSYINEDDIFVYLTKGSVKEPPYVRIHTLELTDVFVKFAKHGIAIDDADQEYISNYVTDAVDTYLASISLAQMATDSQVDGIIAKSRYIVVKSIGDAMVNRLTPIVFRHLLDNSTSEPYFYINEENKVAVNNKIYTLLDALDYFVYEAPGVKYVGITNYVDLLIDSMQREIDYLQQNEGLEINDDVERARLTIHINLSGVNKIKFIRDNELDITQVLEIRFPEVMVSQEELEKVYLDEVVSMLTYETVLDELQQETDLQKYLLDDMTHVILDEVGQTFKLLRESKAPAYRIYEGVDQAFNQMIEIKGKELVNKHKPRNNRVTLGQSNGNTVFSNIGTLSHDGE